MIEISSIYTVEQLNSYIKKMFAQDYLLQSVYVKGEVSNCKYHTSGHIYFTLKDPRGTISCVMFAGSRKGLSFRMQDGQQVIVGGSVDVYERDGKYQIYAKQIRLDGAGLLYERYEQLKQELQELGMFAQEYKRPIPKYVRTLGVVTARTGAAVRDIIQIATRRNPYVQIILYPAVVQGDGAVPSIVSGIRALEQLGVDVMIVGRGGGSIEDLWAFNEREVAQAVFNCSVPIISAVGHETDTTIIDFVADLRAPTPSAAAELAVFDVRELLQRMTGYEDALTQRMKRWINRQREDIRRFERQFQTLSPESRIRSYRQQRTRLEEALSERMNSLLNRRKEKMRGYTGQFRILNPTGKIRSCRQYQVRLEGELTGRMERIMAVKRHELEIYIEKLKGLSPLEKLSGGFSYLEDAEGKQIRSASQVAAGDALKIRMKDGTLEAQVTDVQREDHSALLAKPG